MQRLDSAQPGPRAFERGLEALVVLAALATIPLTVAQEQAVADPLLAVADWVVWAVFLIEYVIMMALTPSRWAYARRNWLSVVVIVLSFPALPNLLEFVRLARLGRLLRLILITIRGLKALRVVLGRPGLVYVGAVSAVVILGGGGAVVVLEPETVKGDFWNGIWWAVVTASTVGYGDVVPGSVEGKVVAIAVMLGGIGLVSTLAASITAYFVGQDESTQLEALDERLKRIEGMLQELTGNDPSRENPPTGPGESDG